MNFAGYLAVIISLFYQKINNNVVTFCTMNFPGYIVDVSVSILEKYKKPRLGKLCWYRNFDTGFEDNSFVKNPVCGGF